MKDKIKVLHVLNELRPSGAETMLKCASKVFNSQKIDTHILATGKTVGSFKKDLEQVGYTVFHIKFKRCIIFPSISFRFKLFKFIKKGNYDVVHIHPEQGYFLTALLAKIAGVKKIIRTVHHIFPLPLTPIRQTQRLQKIVQRAFLKKILHVIFTSNSLSGYQNEINTYCSKNIIIPNWFDSDYFKQVSFEDKLKAKQQLNIEKEIITFISVGGNWEYKNYDLILEAFSKINKNEKILYIQVGPDPTNQLTKKKEHYNINNVRIEGKVDDILIYLHAADVLLMPSSIEGFGIAAVEAMATGLPAILSNRPALNEFYNDSELIELIEPDIDGIYNTVLKFSKYSTKQLFTIGGKIGNNIRNKYRIENGAMKFIGLYKNNLE